MGGKAGHAGGSRLSAWVLHRLDTAMDRQYGAKKRCIFSGFPGSVVEVGPGVGANLRYYRPGTRLVAVEPNPAMHPLLRKNAERHRIALDIRGVRGEAMDLPDGSAAVVVGTLVLCSVDRPERVLAEVLRILTPGGRYVFLEHVAAVDGSGLGRLQSLLHRPWRRIFDGCHLNRHTHRLIMTAGFETVDMNCFRLAGPPTPVTPHIFGQAFKAVEAFRA